ncbi:MAG: polysaccharide deacetylase family protein [Marinomonas foliarum]|jgi:peptidoglycan/xylan/chitin deacetylase (PgdA/CDA1 family)|uniref:Polysaccharide deacetylase n=1 Tax=Marinomonas foliarum TaxID=491950 RepID=A0A368ZSP6_9GAMM|nr:polysaccharide deacetylase family protein [Marinomonas foliarum]RCX00021.1 polysaccharide deacetylase [Marinomonas foliarum]
MLSKARYSVVIAALSASTMLQAQDYLPVLQYHHVSASSPKSTSVTPEQFTEHMDYLKNAGFQVVDLRSALDDLKANKALPEKAVAISFDDAYRNIYQAGFPVLKERNFPFTVFINTEPVERKSRSFLTWEQMKEMEKSGGVFANHTISHPYMLRKEKGETDDAWMSRMTNEVDTVEGLLVKYLGSSPKMLAYPYGESNGQIRSMMKERGIMAFGQQSGVVSADSDFENLPRFPASGAYAKLSTLKTKLNAKPMPLLSEKAGGDYATDQPVSISLTFKEGKYRFKDLACYVSGQGKATLEWLSETEVLASAPKPFGVGRGRINCTMPDNSGQHYYWYSNVWIRSSADQGYVSEKS